MSRILSQTRQEHAIRTENRVAQQAAPRLDSNRAVPDDVALVPESGRVFIRSVRLAGGEMLGQGFFDPVLLPFRDVSLDMGDLQSLARAIGNYARSRGYIFASAIIPKQEIRDGTVLVNFDAGIIDEVRITGTDSKSARRILNRLVGQPRTGPEIERALLMVNDLPGVEHAEARFVRENGKSVLAVTVQAQRVRARAGIDNYGPSTLGPVRVQMSIDFAGLLASDDSLSINSLNTPVRASELAFATAQYGIGIGTGGARVTVTGTLGHLRPGGRLRPYDVSGSTQAASVGLNVPLRRTHASSIWINGQMSFLHIDERAGPNRFLDENVTTAALGLRATTRLGPGRLSGGVDVTTGLSAFNPTRRTDPLSSRPGAGARFVKLGGWINWFGPVANQTWVRVAGAWQYTSRPLLSSQQLSYGGAYFGRGYDFSERSGDRGVMALVEVRQGISFKPRAVEWAHIYASADGAYVDRIGDHYGKPAIFSAGIGIRAGIGPFELDAGVAMPINADRYDDAKSTPKANLGLSLRL